MRKKVSIVGAGGSDEGGDERVCYADYWEHVRAELAGLAKTQASSVGQL